MTCIEVTAENLHIWQLHKKGKILAYDCVFLGPGDLWNPGAMAQALDGPGIKLSKRRVLFWLNTAQTHIRVAETPDIQASFPLGEGFKEEDYIFSHSTIGKRVLLAALHRDLSQSLVDFCKLKGVRPKHIHSIDILEHRLALHYSQRKERGWLFLPQKPGIRVLALEAGMPWGCYFFSNHPKYREKELERIWIGQPPERLPGYAAVWGEGDNWLRDWLVKKGVEVETPVGKEELFREWVKALP